MTDRSKTRVYKSIELHQVRDMETNTWFTLKELLVMLNTKAELGNTVKTDGVIPIQLTGTLNTILTPPETPQPLTGGDYNNYKQVVGLSSISSSGAVSVVDGAFVIGEGGAGDYQTPHAWIGSSVSTNNTVFGFIFAVEKANSGLLNFSQRVAGIRGSEQSLLTNISGGGFINSLEVGDKLTVWVAASKTSTVNISDSNIGLQMVLGETLKL